ncbi:unnamed protein product [Bursaphelenchus okinawaensis]|uniref:Uncharacterized protein n=1 Tax=Bursaphelenchus okinawaensis TaxID=465554 RepID=A0A811KKH3_9BILA|nr:unnamed protein product [Bursaphelenchus okinawaensis]CAG9105609.1 unnamed protein product [Bursaphelenchus okinawaensis]
MMSHLKVKVACWYCGIKHTVRYIAGTSAGLAMVGLAFEFTTVRSCSMIYLPVALMPSITLYAATVFTKLRLFWPFIVGNLVLIGLNLFLIYLFVDGVITGNFAYSSDEMTSDQKENNNILFSFLITLVIVNIGVQSYFEYIIVRCYKKIEHFTHVYDMTSTKH